MEVNTALNFNIGPTYDLYSVLLHETGHSLGLDHAKNPVEVMNAVYGGTRPGLSPGDIAGIQAIYGIRTVDAYQQQGLGYGFSSAIDVSAGLLTATQSGVTGVELADIGGAEYFSFVAPAYASGDIQVTAAAGNMSMLSPAVTLYDAAGNPLAQAANPSAWSDNVTATAHGVVPGQRYYVKVTGATHDVFSVGAYAISVSLPSSTAPKLPPSPPPTVGPRPPTPANVVIPDRFEPNNSAASATRLGRVKQATLGGINLSSGTDLDYFQFQTTRAGSYQINAPGVVIQAFNSRGKLLGGGVNGLTLPSARAGTVYRLRISTPTTSAVPAYSITINSPAILAARRKVAKPRHLEVAPADAGSLNLRSPAVAPARLDGPVCRPPGPDAFGALDSPGTVEQESSVGSSRTPRAPFRTIWLRPRAFGQGYAEGRQKRPRGLTWG